MKNLGPSSPVEQTRKFVQGPAGKAAGLVGAVAIALTVWALYSGDQVACDSPRLMSEFQRLFQEQFDANMEGFRKDNDTYSINHFKDYKLVVRSTSTLGPHGRLIVCAMTWDYGNPQWSQTFHYAVGKDDQGNLIWRFDGRAPYQITKFD